MPIFKEFEKMGFKYSIGFNTSTLSSIKAGGVALAAVYPRDVYELILLLGLIKSYGIDFTVMGRATNTLFSDDGYDGIIVCTERMNGYSLTDKLSVRISSGAILSRVIYSSAALGLELSSGLFGIPGSVGGAVRGNAGAFGCEIADIFVAGKFLNTENMKILTLTKEDMQFSYRTSLLKREDLIFLSGEFKVYKKSSQELRESLKAIRQRRKAAQPSLPSLGSFFKRCKEAPVSKLIDEAGLKGFAVGGAQISKKHAGFIVNAGGASAKDIITLGDYVSKVLIKKYNIAAEREIEFIG